MKVAAKVSLPQHTPVTITIEATLGELQELRNEIGGSGHWSKLGELVISTIRQVGTNLQDMSEQIVEVEP